MGDEHILGWWYAADSKAIEYVVVAGEAGLADERQRRDDQGGWQWMGSTPCDCGCTGEVEYV